MRAPAIGLLGGLDLTTPAPLARAGTLADCENYEVDNRKGYSRIAGFERFDGRPGVAEFRILLLNLSSVEGTIAIGNRVKFANAVTPAAHEEVDGYVISLVPAGAGFVACVVFAGGMGDPVVPDTLTAVGGSTASCTGFVSLSEPVGTQAALDSALFLLANARRAQVTRVPGRAGSDVLGGFLFKNSNYAIRDLPRIFFQDGYYTDEDEGLHILIGAVEHRILDVRVLGENAGYVVYDPVPSNGTDAVGVGSPTLTTLPVSGSLDSAFFSIAYADGLVVSGGTPPYFWSIAETESSTPPAPEIGDLSQVTLQSEVTPAALWRATPTGWSRVECGRELAFTAGAAALRSTPRALNVDPSEPRTSSWLFPTNSTINGVNAPNLNADDGTNAALGGTDGQTILCRGFSFASIPAGAQILGIEARVERSAVTGGLAVDGVVTLGGVAGGTENKAGPAWDTAMTTRAYGGSTDLWGSENITRQTLDDTSFGVLVLARRNVPSQAIDALVDHVAIRVTYAERGGIPAWLWNSTADVPITIINVQALEGDAGQGSASGYITLLASPNSAKPRQVRAGDQIRSAPSGGGALLGLVASRDRPIFLPGQFEVGVNRSQYAWQQHNFFGQDQYAAMYGVSGAGPAVAFDGTNIIKIRTPLSPGADIPRHLAKHGSMLALGYFSGAVILSSVGQPYEMRGTFGATAVETGDRLTALTAGGGDALIIVCETSTFVLRGLSPRVFTQQTVSAQRGAIEYTAADPGQAIIADSFGLFGAMTPESFQPANRAYMSEPVQPWLRERLQATISNEQRFLRPVAALAVRSKNQYRLYFADGAVLTMTMAGAGIEITRQRLTSAAGPITVRALWSGIDASGRERIFGSFAGAKDGLVFEMDNGRSFDGDPISAFMVINPLNAGSISQTKFFDRIFYGGDGGYASLEWSFGVNSKLPVGREVQADLGRTDDNAAAPSGRRRSSKLGSLDIGVEAYDLVLKVSSLTATEAQHTLAYIEPFITAVGDSRGHRGD